MHRTRRPLLVLVALVVALALLAAGCGGGGGGSGSLPKNAIAKVGDVTIARAELNEQFDRARRSYKLQKRDFPKAGTAEYGNLQNRIVQSLVQQAELKQKAKELGVTVTDAQVKQRIDQYKQQSVGGSDAKYRKQLAAYGLTPADAEELFRSQLLSNGVYDKVTADVKVTEKELRDYYAAHKSQYTQPETREVQHILVGSRALAQQILQKLRAGASFDKLAKRYSTDTSNKDQGGRMTIQRGQTVPPFDKAAFSMKTGALAGPVKTQYGWHVIRALGDVQKAKTQSFAAVKESIRQQLLTEKRGKEIQQWVKEVQKQFAGVTAYAPGFAPPQATATATG